MPDISLRRVDQSTAKPKLIVIFVHGLGGDPVSTWCHEGGEADGYFWPRGIAEKIEGCAVFTLGYPADKAAWNTGWPIATAAVSVLDKLMSAQAMRECGDAPIAFVCHSLGGLIIKKLVITAHLDRQQQPAKGKFLDRIAGIAFLATPHSGSIMADIASWAYWFVSDSLNDLHAGYANLLDLSHTYRERIANGEARIRHRVYYEMVGKWGALIVSHDSANPGLPGTRPVGVERDHMSICKPLDAEDTVYEGVLAFLQDEVLQSREASKTENLDASVVSAKEKHLREPDYPEKANPELKHSTTNPNINRIPKPASSTNARKHRVVSGNYYIPQHRQLLPSENNSDQEKYQQTHPVFLEVVFTGYCRIKTQSGNIYFRVRGARISTSIQGGRIISPNTKFEIEAKSRAALVQRIAGNDGEYVLKIDTVDEQGLRGNVLVDDGESGQVFLFNVDSTTHIKVKGHVEFDTEVIDIDLAATKLSRPRISPGSAPNNKQLERLTEIILKECGDGVVDLIGTES